MARLAVIAIGFSGVVIAMNPGVGELNPGVVYSLLGMLAYAFFMILTRYMAAFDPPMVTLFYSMFVGTFLGAPLAYSPGSRRRTYRLGSCSQASASSAAWAIGCFLHAYRLALPRRSPFLYFQLISMISFGYLVFDQLPDLQTLFGAAIVVASGIYLFQQERKNSHPAFSSRTFPVVQPIDLCRAVSLTSDSFQCHLALHLGLPVMTFPGMVPRQVGTRSTVCPAGARTRQRWRGYAMQQPKHHESSSSRIAVPTNGPARLTIILGAPLALIVSGLALMQFL